MNYEITIRAGANWNRVGSFTVGGELTQLDDIACKIRKGMSKDAALVLDLEEFITQETPGKPIIMLTAEATALLTPTLNDQRYYIDMFGTAGGQRYKVMPTLPVIVEAFVSDE